MEGVEEAIIPFIINYHLLFKTPKANETTLIVIKPKKGPIFISKNTHCNSSLPMFVKFKILKNTK